MKPLWERFCRGLRFTPPYYPYVLAFVAGSAFSGLLRFLFNVEPSVFAFSLTCGSLLIMVGVCLWIDSIL